MCFTVLRQHGLLINLLCYLLGTTAATLVSAGCNPSTLSIYFLILEVIVTDNASTGESSMLCMIPTFW